MRLTRRRKDDLAELRAVQAERKVEETAQLDEAVELLTLAEALGETFNPAANGFEFSTAQLKQHRDRRRAASQAAASRKSS